MRTDALQQRFADLLERHGISLATPRGMVRCLFHDEKTPSLSIDIERCIFHCFGCGVGGGVKEFARLAGEEWAVGKSKASTPALRRERARMAIATRRRAAEVRAYEILQRRKDEQYDTLWAAWCEANTVATHTAELLSLFFRRPDLAEEFPRLVSIIESEYSDALFQKMVLEAQFAGEVAQ